MIILVAGGLRLADDPIIEYIEQKANFIVFAEQLKTITRKP